MSQLYRDMRKRLHQAKLNELMKGMVPKHADKKAFTPHLKDKVAIKCVDCGMKHLVFKQDAKQVKRCFKCQRKYRIYPHKRIEGAHNVVKHTTNSEQHKSIEKRLIQPDESRQTSTTDDIELNI